MQSNGPIRTLDRVLQLLLANVVAFSLLLMALVVITLVIGRSIFGVAFFWGEELARYTMIFMAFVGGAVAIRVDQHPRLTVFTSMLPQRAQTWLERLMIVLLAVTLAVLFVQGLDVAIHDGRMKTPALRIKYFWVFLSVPIGAAAMLAMLVFRQFFAPIVAVDEQDDIEEVGP